MFIEPKAEINFFFLSETRFKRTSESFKKLFPHHLEFLHLAQVKKNILTNWKIHFFAVT